jgi:hypothetical protein
VEKVHAVAESTISRHLLRGDVFERGSDDSYLVLFATLDKAQADFKCRVISKEIARHLLGTHSAVLASLETVRADVPREALASGDVEAILEQALVQGVRTTTTRAEVQAESEQAPPEVLFLGESAVSPAGDDAMLEDGPVVARAAHGRQTVDYGRGAETGAQPPASGQRPEGLSRGALGGVGEPHPSPIGNRLRDPIENGMTPDMGAEPVVELPRTAASVELGAPPAAHQPVEWRYSPIWDFEKSALIRFRLSASAGGRTIHPYSGTHPDTSEAALFTNDLRAVAKVLRDLAVLASQGRRLPVVCPVHFSSVSLESRRAQLFHELRNGPAQGSRLLVLEVVRPPQALWARGFLDIADAFRRSGFPVSMCLPVDRLAEVDAIAPHVQELTTETPGGGAVERVKIEQLNAFVRRTRTKGIDAGAYGLGTRSLVMAALGGGFRFLSGEAVHESAATLDHALRFEALDLYLRR